MSTRPELTYDGNGINGPDEYRARIATFTTLADAERYGPMFATAPEMLEALRRAENFLKNVPTDAQLDATLGDKDTGRNIWAAVAAALAQAEGRT